MTITIFILDTSYLLELLSVPGSSNGASIREIKKRYEEAINNESRIYVPLPCIFELANHIADINDGNLRQEFGKKFSEIIRSCVKENTPWIITPPCDMEILPQLCEVFANRYVLQGIGLTDANIVQESQRLKAIYRSFKYKVHIWTKHANLKACEPDHEINPFLG